MSEPSLQPRAVALVLAAGVGERLGLGEPKGFVVVGGRPLLEHSLATVACCPFISAVVLVVPDDRISEATGMADRVRPRPQAIAVVAGGSSRQESVRLGLEALPRAELVVCHDAARPFATPELFARVLDALAGGGAAGAVPVVASPDTVKRIRQGAVVETIPRAEVGLVQTPQAFVVEALRDVHRGGRRVSGDATDDAGLLEEAGYRVVTVEGEPGNFKITDRADLARAEEHLQAEDPGSGDPG